MKNKEIIEKDLVYVINKCVFEVYRVLGHGFLKKVYDAQLLNYLKATGMEVGLLINFGDRVEIKRKVLHQP